MNSVGEFVVGLNVQAIQRARSRTFIFGVISAVCDFIATAGVVVLGLLLLMLGKPIGLLSIVLAVFFALVGVRKLRAFLKLRDVQHAQGLPPWAMRFSGFGVEIGIDATPGAVFLPWGAIYGFRLYRWRFKQFMVVDLFPGVDANTPGVVGLERPDVQNTLNKRIFGTKGLRWAVRNLDQPVPVVDQAAAYFTGGRVRVH